MTLASTDILPPPGERGIRSWLRRKFFSTPLSALITVVFGALVVWIAWRVVDWAFVRAIWSLADRAACGHGAGACWAVIEARGRLVLFGLYPYEEHWRSALACLAIIVTMVLSCLPWFWHMTRLPLLWVAGFAVFIALMYGGFLGLSVVTTEQWGGLALTVFIFCSVALIGMPFGTLLALARRSEMAVIRRLAAVTIDVVRSLPLLAILFAAAVVMPLAVPDWAQGDKLARVIVAFGLFFACYEAEIIRAGMQATPAGQEEAAVALGMKYWPRMFTVLLPQAFRNSLPATINQFVITFKETSIVTIIGFFEVMASGNAATGTGDWTGQYLEVYVFVALIYFVFVFGLSRYGASLERRARAVRH